MNVTAEVMSTILEVAATLLIALIGVAGAWILSKINKGKNLENIAAATEHVIKVAQLTVGELRQTIADELKDKNGGKLTPDDIKKLQFELLNQTSKKISEPVAELLNSAKVDVNALISGAAEAHISGLGGGV